MSDHTIRVFRQSRDYLYGWVAEIDGHVEQAVTASPTRKRATERAHAWIERGCPRRELSGD